MTLTGESTTWPITNTIKPASYFMVGFKNLPDSQTNNNNIFRVAKNQEQDPIVHKVQIFGGIAAVDAAAVAAAVSAAVKSANAKKAADAQNAEDRRHNLAMEKEARGSGVAEILGTVKEFGKRFSEETKKLLNKD
ncbi:hypothetical protein LOTGIDRAFT_158414 [Lottia gigantea]|uniref:Uncharacterized protein n=1 Tax=Lottia gigantea TaxID=225164 RepID=V4AQ44_LOTGI|nr:hypothetical protein LOTGIDRAFT_158414 [Lottia gigantea]ESO99327.1 hypothetical protein LOTGIDRAFT_158414 [Lottia gigantea]